MPIQIAIYRSFAVASICVAAATDANAVLTYYTNSQTFQQLTSTSVVEDFENAAQLNVALLSFTHNGITYTGLAGFDSFFNPFPNVVLASAGADNFGTPPTQSVVLTANGDEDFTIQFGSPTKAVGFDTYVNIYGPANIQVFGDSGNLGTFSLTQDSTRVGFFGVTADVPITSVRWTTTNGRQVNTGIDNLRTGFVASVPEANSWAVLSLGLVLIAAAIRQQKLNK